MIALALFAFAAPALASESEGFGIEPGSFTVQTCSAVELTCTSATPLETQAGAHPDATVAFTFDHHAVPLIYGGRSTTGSEPNENVKNIEVRLPPGLIGNPQATPQCSEQALEASNCPTDTIVGYTTVLSTFGSVKTFEAPAGTLRLPVYNVTPEPGQTAQFGFVLYRGIIHIVASVRTSSDYGIDTTATDVQTTTGGVVDAALTFWGVPAEHNGPGPLDVSGGTGFFTIGSPGAGARIPFLTNPTNCSTGPVTTTLSVDAWQDPGVFQYTDASSPAPTGCGSVPFDPSLTVRPLNTQVDTPSGYEVTLSLPQNENPSGLAEAELDEARVTLPAGVSINPSAANGLGGCSDEQYGYQTNNAVACPGSSKIGTVSVTTPLLAEPLTGAVYLGQPLNDNPQSGEMYRLFFVLNGPGLLIKIKGGVVADPTTGQLTATFAGNPPLPFNLLSMRFNGGERAALANPASCESSSTTSLFTSYAGQSVAWSDPVTFSYDGQGGACPASMPFSPAFNAGTVTPLAAGFSPFTLSFSRTDGQQTLSHISTTLPKGLLADLASVPLCDEAQANAGTCSPASQIGVATVGAGAGSEPFYVSGPVYLTGGYGGGPFGLSVAVPAVAGPFNLGTVVVRAAIHVDPSTAAVTVVSDPLPQILDGVPLRIQNVNVTVNRPNFTFNPTSCAEQSVTATIASAQGASAAVSSPFDVGGCQGLPFKPSFTVSTQARTSKADGASLDVKVASGSGQANIAKVDVTLPTALPSRLTTLQKACTEAQFATNPAGCPAGSFVGVATALTPILSVPLTGPAILVSHGGAAFPDLVVVLQGEGVTIELTGNTDIKKGVTYSKFETVPDAPISTFELKLPEGPHSILATNLPTKANYNLCGQNLTMPTTITGQNGAVVKQTTKITVIGCPKAKKATHKKAATLSRHSKATTKGRP